MDLIGRNQAKLLELRGFLGKRGEIVLKVRIVSNDIGRKIQALFFEIISSFIQSTQGILPFKPRAYIAVSVMGPMFT